MTAKVDAYLARHPEWAAPLAKLRGVLLDTGLVEAIKWGGPCYTFNGKNLIGLGAFKNHIALWFHQGALLKDETKRLVNAQEGTTRALRQWRFRQGERIPVRLIKSYVREAMALQAAGKKIRVRQNRPIVMPDELQALLAGDNELNTAFLSCSKSKQREYADYTRQAPSPSKQ